MLKFSFGESSAEKEVCSKVDEISQANKNGIFLKPVGVIHSPYRERGEAPRQGRFSDKESVLEIFDEYAPALKDVEESRWYILLYWADRASRDVLQTVTPHGPEIRGVFACRSPARPNPILFCVVELLRREGNRLVVKGSDALDGSTIVDIKPYSARTDCVPDAEIGWLSKKEKEIDLPEDKKNDA